MPRTRARRPRSSSSRRSYARAAARDAAHDRDTLAERALTANERLATLERSLAEREGIPPAARALAEQGERLAMSLLHVEPGDERAVAAALGARASALVAPTAKAALELLERAAASGLGSLRVLAGRDPRELVDELPVVEQSELSAVDGSGGHARGLRLRPAARRALVRGRDRRGGAARARVAPRRARGRGEVAGRAVAGSPSVRPRAPTSRPRRPKPRSRRRRRGCASAAPTSPR